MAFRSILHFRFLSSVLAFVRSGVTASICVSAGRRLHRKMFERVVNSPIRFFDTNSSGRILNRFSKDTGNMDDMVPITFFDFSCLLALSVGNTVYAAVIVPWVLLPIVPLVVMLVLIRYFRLMGGRKKGGMGRAGKIMLRGGRW